MGLQSRRLRTNALNDGSAFFRKKRSGSRTVASCDISSTRAPSAGGFAPFYVPARRLRVSFIIAVRAPLRSSSPSGFARRSIAAHLSTRTGRIYVCERAERTPSYGDVNSGAIDYQRLERDLAFVQYVVDEVVECRRCFAARFCQLCWVVFLRERVLQVRERPDAIAREMASACRAMRRAFRREMSLYAYLCERAPELLDEFAPPDAEAHDAIATRQLRALDSLVGVRSPNVPSTETREV